MPEASTTGVHNAAPEQGGLGGLVILSLLLIGVVVGFFYWWHNFRNVSGTIQADAPTLGQWTMHPDRCRMLPDGQGAELSQLAQPGLRVTVRQDPEGGTALLYLVSPQDGRSYELEHDRCGESNLSLRKGEDGLTTSGQLIFNCVVAKTGTVHGNVSFRNCK